MAAVAAAALAPAQPAPAAAAPGSPVPPDEPTGPLEVGNTHAGKPKRQYCWWATFSYPYAETVARKGLKMPDDFTRESFGEAVKAAHAKLGVPLEEVDVCKSVGNSSVQRMLWR